MSFKISIIFCSYNRGELLEEVLRYTFDKVKDIEKCEVIVIDNNSPDDTKDRVNRLMKLYPNLSYEFEKKQGLSHARNAAIEIATTPYILYLDDDALADDDLITKYLKILQERPDIKVLGGVYTPWYKYGRPSWYLDEYGSKTFDHPGLHQLEGEEYVSGGIMLFHKETFLRSGNFNPNLGMKKDMIYYGEETDLQIRMQENGIKVYGDDGLIIKHIVAEKKLNVKWFFQQKRMIGKLQAEILDSGRIINAIKALIIGAGQALVSTGVNIVKLFSRKYRVQNFIIDSYSKPYKWFSFSYYLIKGVK